MAVLTLAVDGVRYAVTVRGQLTVADLRRLVGICQPAFDHRELPLTIDLVDRAVPDEAALFILGRLAARGAVITGPGADAIPTTGRGG